MGRRMQPQNEKFFALFSKAGSKPTTLPRACAAARIAELEDAMADRQQRPERVRPAAIISVVLPSADRTAREYGTVLRPYTSGGGSLLPLTRVSSPRGRLCEQSGFGQTAVRRCRRRLNMTRPRTTMELKHAPQPPASTHAIP